MDNEEMETAMDSNPSEVTPEMKESPAKDNERLLQKYESALAEKSAEIRGLRDHISYIEDKLGRANKHLELIQTITQMH